ncbi:MAG: Flp pilus assembly complex ATPase component TadA [Polyangiaceae bacterium]|nr:Flp pilus assembly complex ATPase component TadA [Polyangiaceae bacterium]
MFAVIISEKGGAERRETFDRTEITVGRVQGNDLMLPKGNVSKRHAKLSLKDSHCIVTDLNSTNGTYVNRRRIAQPTAVRDGDRIYIGDFILRVELGSGASGEAVAHPAEPHATNSPEQTVGAVERSTGSDAGFALPAVPRPPRLPTGTRDPDQSSPVKPVPIPAVALASDTPDAGSEPLLRALVLTPDLDAKSYGAVLAALVARVTTSVGSAVDRDDAEGRARVTSSIGAALAMLRSEGRIPQGVSVQRLVADAEQEISEFGPAGLIWRDATVSALVITAFDHMVAIRGEEAVLVEPSFTSEVALHRIVRRLCARNGVPLGDGECIIDRNLAGGVALAAVLRPVASRGAVMLLRRVRQPPKRLDELVGGGVVSSSVAAFTQLCVAAHVNLLVIGPRGAGTTDVVGALESAIAGGRLVVIQQSMTLPVVDGATLLGPSTGGGEGRLIEFAARLPDSRLVIELTTPPLALGFAESAGVGLEGVVAVAYGQSIERTFARLVAEVAAAGRGYGLDVARELLAGSIDIVLEVRRGPDGTTRVERVAELGPTTPGNYAPKDLFKYSAGEPDAKTGRSGSVVATGAVPRIVEVIRSRGVAVDPSLFECGPRR